VGIAAILRVGAAVLLSRKSRTASTRFITAGIARIPARIAEVALWLTDHQANVRLSEAFGQFYKRIPLRKSPHIHVANALRTDWRTIISPEECSYILGNPPFVGKHYQSKEQRADMVALLPEFGNVGDLDFVSGWYFKAANYIQATNIKVGLVSTNSITQGEQVSVLWPALFDRYHITLHFAHRTFAWESEARGKAHVHVVIIGFGLRDVPTKRITDYDVDPDNPTVAIVSNISPYLTEGSNTVVRKERNPIGAVPEMRCGNKPSDGGNFILTELEKTAFVATEPAAAKFLRPYIGAEEFINGWQRWCLWLKDATPSENSSISMPNIWSTSMRERLKTSASPICCWPACSKRSISNSRARNSR
jgi:hypothetical protein